MRKTGEEPPTRQFPSVEVCESYTSVMFERESSDRFSHKRADPVSLTVTALWIHLHRDPLNPEREVDILSTLCAGKIASVTAGATDYKSDNPVDVFVMCDFDTHSPCGFPSYTSVPWTYDGLPLPSLASIKDAYESIRMEVVGDTFEWEVLLDRIHVKESDGLERFWTQLSKRYQGDDRNILREFHCALIFLWD